MLWRILAKCRDIRALTHIGKMSRYTCFDACWQNAVIHALWRILAKFRNLCTLPGIKCWLAGTFNYSAPLYWDCVGATRATFWHNRPFWATKMHLWQQGIPKGMNINRIHPEGVMGQVLKFSGAIWTYRVYSPSNRFPRGEKPPNAHKQKPHHKTW